MLCNVKRQCPNRSNIGKEAFLIQIIEKLCKCVSSLGRFEHFIFFSCMCFCEKKKHVKIKKIKFKKCHFYLHTYTLSSFASSTESREDSRIEHESPRSPRIRLPSLSAFFTIFFSNSIINPIFVVANGKGLTN